MHEAKATEVPTVTAPPGIRKCCWGVGVKNGVKDSLVKGIMLQLQYLPVKNALIGEHTGEFAVLCSLIGFPRG